MKLSEIKTILNTADSVSFFLEDGKEVPEHFHFTEVGVVTKHFIDCGGKVRNEKKANFQLWDANDYEHRLKPKKLLNIITLSEKTLGMEDLDIEVEYQNETIGKYDLNFNGKDFVLINKHTACLAKEPCGIAENKELVKAETSCCALSGSCC